MTIIAGDEETYSELKNNLRFFNYPCKLLKEEIGTENNEYSTSYEEDIYIQIIKVDRLRLNKLQKEINRNRNKFKKARREINKLELKTPKSQIFRFSEFLKLDINTNSFNDNFFGTNHYSYDLIPLFEQQQYEYIILEDEFKRNGTFYCAWFNYGKAYRPYKFLPKEIKKTFRDFDSIKQNSVCGYEIPSLDYIVFYLKKINIEMKSIFDKGINFILTPIDEGADRYTELLISEMEQDQRYSSYMDSMFDEMNEQAFEIDPDFLADNDYDDENLSFSVNKNISEFNSPWYCND